MKVLESLETLRQSAQSIAQERESGIKEIHEQSAQRIEQHLLSIANSLTQRIESDLKTLETTIKTAQSELETEPKLLQEMKETIIKNNIAEQHNFYKEMKEILNQMIREHQDLRADLINQGEKTKNKLLSSQKMIQEQILTSLGRLKYFIPALIATNIVLSLLIVVFLIK